MDTHNISVHYTCVYYDNTLKLKRRRRKSLIMNINQILLKIALIRHGMGNKIPILFSAVSNSQSPVNIVPNFVLVVMNYTVLIDSCRNTYFTSFSEIASLIGTYYHIKPDTLRLWLSVLSENV